MKKETLFGSEAKDLLAKGAQMLHDAVSVTLGAKGKNVVLKLTGGLPIITKDGVTVAGQVWDKDPFVMAGIEVVQQAAFGQYRKIGDGTTSCIVATNAIIQEGLNQIQANKSLSTVELKQGMDSAVKDVSDFLATISNPITDKETLKQIALVSANGDHEIATVVADVVHTVGVNGTIGIEQYEGNKLKYEVVPGCPVESGYYHPNFINTGRRTCVLENPLVLVSDEPIDTIQRIKPFISYAANAGRPLFIIARVYEGDAYNLLLANSNSSNPNAPIGICGIKAPDHGNMTIEVMRDIATLCGATIWSKREGRERGEPTLFGGCAKVEVHADKTVIYSGHGALDAIKNRIELIREQITVTEDAYDKETLKTRYARMDGRVGIIYVGGASNVELEERKARVDDSYKASMAAMEEGYVGGGGIALLAASKHIEAHQEIGARGVGRSIVAKALRVPYDTILSNAGRESSTEYSYPNGINVKTDTVCDMVASGIIDPTKVCRLIVENAVSVASTFLMTECAIVQIDEDRPE